MAGKREDRREARKALLYTRLITLMQLADLSAEIAYPRRLHMPNINRQLIFMIGMYGVVASKDLAIASGREKAQISRGIKALGEAGLIDRIEPRGPVALNAAGRTVYGEILKITRERDLRLRKGLSDGDVARFLDMTMVLADRASRIFVADEQDTDIDMADRTIMHHPPEAADNAADAGQPAVRELILPWLQSLKTYMRRSGTTLFRREFGLSSFEWRLLSLITEHQPVNLASLIALVGRDKSQVARGVKQLHMDALVERRDQGRINAALTPSALGRAHYERLFAISTEREAFLYGAHQAEDRRFYETLLDRLTANAGEMLAEERELRGDAVPAPKPERGALRTAAAARADRKGGADEVAKLRDENARLKRLLAETMLENARLRESVA